MTTMEVEIVPAKFEHAYELSGNLRFNDWSEIAAVKLRPFTAIRRSMKASRWNKTALVNGHVAAMWGLGGIMLGTATPWLFTSKYVEQAPLSFLRYARQEVEDMLSYASEIRGIVSAEYLGALRLLETLGFNITPPFEHEGARFCTYSKRAQ